MISRIVAFAIFCVIGAITFMSLFAGYSRSADIFCNKYAGTTDLAVGPNGLVVMWMRVMGISILAWISLFSLLALIAFVNFDKEKYTTFRKERQTKEDLHSDIHLRFSFFIPKDQYEFESSGNKLYDARLYYEMHEVQTVNLTDVVLLLATIHYFVWIILGLIILREYVPQDCYDKRMGNTTSLTLMYTIVFASIAPFVSTIGFYLLLHTTSHS